MGLSQEELEKRQTQVVTDDYFMKYRWDLFKLAENCTRWGTCRFVGSRRIQSQRFSRICPSSVYYLFDSYSLQGRLNLTFGMLEGRLNYDNAPAISDIFYACNMCGGCDVMCKSYCNEGESLRVVEEMRAKLVSDGQIQPAHLPIIDSLRKEDNTMQRPKAERGDWAEGLDVKRVTDDPADVYYHVGCLESFDESLWNIPRSTVSLLQKMGVDVGISGRDESCCGGRVYEMGYVSELTKFAESNIEAWRGARVKQVVTSCGDCYYAFKRLYPQFGSDVEVSHIVEWMAEWVKQGKLKFEHELPMKVTYHDPCHLGRRSHVYVPGEPVTGVFDPPRDVIRSIPGVELVEMERIREYAWCCGAGGGVKDAYPEFNAFTAAERIAEAHATGAEAIVTACPYCVKNFRDQIELTGDTMRVYDIVELVNEAMQIG